MKYFFLRKQRKLESTPQAAVLNPSVEKSESSEGEETKETSVFRAEMCWTRVFNINTAACGLHHGRRDLNTDWTQLQKTNPAGGNGRKKESVTIFSSSLLLIPHESAEKCCISRQNSETALQSKRNNCLVLSSLNILLSSSNLSIFVVMLSYLWKVLNMDCTNCNGVVGVVFSRQPIRMQEQWSTERKDVTTILGSVVLSDVPLNTGAFLLTQTPHQRSHPSQLQAFTKEVVPAL